MNNKVMEMDSTEQVASPSMQEIYAICDKAERISGLISCYHSSQTSAVEEAYGQLLAQLTNMGAATAQTSSSSIADLKCKIKLWKMIAPDCIFNSEDNTIDEKLLISIIDDFLNLK